MGDENGGEPKYNTTFDEYFRRMNGNFLPGNCHRFLSIEPILTDVCEVKSEEPGGGKLLRRFIHKERFAGDFEWVIVGAESGSRQGKVVPEREWIEKLVQLGYDGDITIEREIKETPEREQEIAEEKVFLEEIIAKVKGNK